MQVSLDGGETFQTVDEVRLVFKVEVPHEDEPEGELHIRYSDEGVIHDIWRSPDLTENLYTESATINEVMEYLTD